MIKIILDWDDTLFPTTSYFIMGWKLNWIELDNKIYHLLYTIKKIGMIYIVTNANKMWVLNLLEKLPLTNSLMNNILIFSARDIYENKIPMELWKSFVFTRIVKKDDNNVIIIGDSDCEKDALIELYKINNSRCLKLIRFIKNPSYHMVKDQLELLTLFFNDKNLVMTEKNMDFEFVLK